MFGPSRRPCPATRFSGSGKRSPLISGCFLIGCGGSPRLVEEASRQDGKRHMRIGAVIAVALVLAVIAFALDHGVYVGSERVVMGAPCCAELDYIQRRYKFLFVTRSEEHTSELQSRVDIS